MCIIVLVMTVAYNPFEILSLPLIRRLIQQGNHYIVLQRFSWPGIRKGSGFIATPYATEKNAGQHQSRLSRKEGKTLSLKVDIGTITNLMDDLRYHLFLCIFRDLKWEGKVLKLHQNNMLSFLRANLNISDISEADINLYLNDGLLKANVVYNDSEYEYDLYEMIK